MKQHSKKQTTAILNEGINTTYIDVSSEGYDIGIHDKGLGTRVFGGSHKIGTTSERWWENKWIQSIAILSSVLGILGFLFSIYESI